MTTAEPEAGTSLEKLGPGCVNTGFFYNPAGAKSKQMFRPCKSALHAEGNWVSSLSQVRQSLGRHFPNMLFSFSSSAKPQLGSLLRSCSSEKKEKEKKALGILRHQINHDKQLLEEIITQSYHVTLTCICCKQRLGSGLLGWVLMG